MIKSFRFATSNCTRIVVETEAPSLVEVLVDEDLVFLLETVEENCKVMEFYFFKGERDEG